MNDGLLRRRAVNRELARQQKLRDEGGGTYALVGQ